MLRQLLRLFRRPVSPQKAAARAEALEARAKLERQAGHPGINPGSY